MTLVREDHRAIIIVQWGKRDTANQQAKAWDPDSGGDETFRAVRLSSDGTEPPSHTAANTALTDEMRAQVLDAMNNVPFVEVYFASDGWDFESALEDQGLQVIEAEVV